MFAVSAALISLSLFSALSSRFLQKFGNGDDKYGNVVSRRQSPVNFFPEPVSENRTHVIFLV